MDRLININGKSYKAAPFDLNLICDFEDAGISLEDIEKKMLNVIRLYVAISMNTDAKSAGIEITEHIANGGSLDDISDAMTEQMGKSGFFRTKQTNEDKGSQKRTRKKNTEKSENEDVIS